MPNIVARCCVECAGTQESSVCWDVAATPAARATTCAGNTPAAAATPHEFVDKLASLHCSNTCTECASELNVFRPVVEHSLPSRLYFPNELITKIRKRACMHCLHSVWHPM